jgi:acetyl-CoA carboxylase biotin carboxylase subunit
MDKILIANRGEIASRIIRSAREMGIATVAVYSEADRNAPFVKLADEAFLIGAPPSDQSYLKGDKIIEVALACGAKGIHPGYGFLSENASFARDVAKAGLKLIGPSPEAMEVMGSKLAAKATVKKYNIPMVPGTDEAITDTGEALEAAKSIGFPVLIKASAGGGGKGMRIVEDEGSFITQLERAVSEAKSSFGDGSVFIERYVGSPRHIEIQILADEHGNIVHLFERECSIQRRHQKVIEEAPSSILTEEMRLKMGACAVDVARSCNYIGAGTVEFLLDENLDFFFLEMNTRLQVEHPVTEFITGLDIVKEQIKIARGEKLSYAQDEVSLTGHAIEVRVYAEDPFNGFLPDIGTLECYEPPKGQGVRVDDGFVEGMEIPIYYDPMISKLITYGRTREEARKRMLNAISDYKVKGVSTTLDFCHFALSHEAFISGKFDTHFVKKYFTPEKMEGEEYDLIGAIAAGLVVERTKKLENGSVKTVVKSNWRKR